jgi:hypothetical protein
MPPRATDNHRQKLYAATPVARSNALPFCLLWALVSCSSSLPASPAVPPPTRLSAPPPSASVCPAPTLWTGSDVEPGQCSTDAGCTQGKRARCGVVPFYKGPGRPHFAGWTHACLSDVCETDVDCGDEQLCHCATGIGGTNQCAPGDCRVDSDCPSGACAAADYRPWLASLPPPNYSVKYCRRERDLCRNDNACSGGACEYVAWRRRFECVAQAH